jgi:hypothetical protein
MCGCQATSPLDAPHLSANGMKEKSVVEITNDGDVPPPLTISAVVKEYAKRKPMQIYAFGLEIRGQRDNYEWLLFRHSLDKPLAPSGIFKNAGNHPGLGAEEYTTGINGEKVNVIYFYNEDAFRAIRLPKEGPIKFDPLILTSGLGVRELEVWEVQSLKVNGETPLEDWLPFDSSSKPTRKAVNSRAEADRRTLSFEANLNVNANSSDVYRSRGEVKTIVATGIRKWTIPFNPKEKN